MRTFSRIKFSLLAGVLAFCVQAQLAKADVLADVHSQADLDRAIASASDEALKQALRENSAAILAAAERRPHVDAVVHTIESAPGSVEKINTTPAGLKKAAGGDVALFDSLKGVDLSVPGMGPHEHRTADPYDAAFLEHLGHIDSLESITIISTQANDQWIAPLGKLTHLKALKFINNGKLTDSGLEQLAKLSEMENFAYVGTAMEGHAFAKFDGWTHLTRASFRGSSIDDEGLKQLCDHFPNLESISLAHAKFTDAGAANLAKLTTLKGLEIGTHNATPQCLAKLADLPLEYLQLGEGFDDPQVIHLISGFHSLRRLTLTDAKKLTDADLAAIAGMKHLESLEFSNLELPDERVPQLQAFSFLKTLRLLYSSHGYPAATQKKIKELLPQVKLVFQ